MTVAEIIYNYNKISGHTANLDYTRKCSETEE